MILHPTRLISVASLLVAFLAPQSFGGTTFNALNKRWPTFDQASAGNNGAGTATFTIPVTTSGPNELLLLAITWKSNTPIATVPTGGPGGWTAVGTQVSQAFTLSTQIYRAFAPTKLTAATVTVSIPGSVKATGIVASFVGANPSGTSGSGAIDSVNMGTAVSLNPSVNLLTAAPRVLVVGFLGTGDITLPTAGAGMTLRLSTINAGGGGGTTKTSTSFGTMAPVTSAPATNVPVTFTLASIDWTEVAVGIKP
jgi:hypothetical protein